MGKSLTETEESSSSTYTIELTQEAFKQLKEIKKNGLPSVKKRLERIFAEIAINPMDSNGFASAEKLKHFPNNEIWSRELSKKDRVVYEVFEDKKTVLVSRLLGHYLDKKIVGRRQYEPYGQP